MAEFKAELTQKNAIDPVPRRRVRYQATAPTRIHRLENGGFRAVATSRIAVPGLRELVQAWRHRERLEEKRDVHATQQPRRASRSVAAEKAQRQVKGPTSWRMRARTRERRWRSSGARAPRCVLAWPSSGCGKEGAQGGRVVVRAGGGAQAKAHSLKAEAEAARWRATPPSLAPSSFWRTPRSASGPVSQEFLAFRQKEGETGVRGFARGG